MFKAVEQKPKFWYVKNGVPGTAHIDRKGAIVDFRPARCFPTYYTADNSMQLTLWPAKGVKLEPLNRLFGSITDVVYAHPYTTIHAQFRLPETNQMFYESARAPGHHVIPGFPQPAEHVAQTHQLLRDMAERQRQKPDWASKEECAAAFGAWVHTAVTDPAKRRIIGRYARTGRNSQQMQKLVNDAFAHDERHGYIILRHLDWRKLVLAA